MRVGTTSSVYSGTPAGTLNFGSVDVLQSDRLASQNRDPATYECMAFFSLSGPE